MKTPKECALKLLEGQWLCHECGSREFEPRSSALLRCAKCGTVNFEAGSHFQRVLKDDDTPLLVRKYMHRLLAKDWEKCPHCKQRYKALQKHINKRHGDLFPEPEKDLFGGVQGDLETHAIESTLVEGPR